MNLDNLKLVTMTGADDSVTAAEMISISKAFPHVEWGILFGSVGGSTGATRFPSNKWLAKELPKLGKAKVNLSAHLCGPYVRQLVVNGDFLWKYVYSELADYFQRIQINFHGGYHKFHQAFKYRIAGEPYQFMLQVDGVNDGQIAKLVKSGHVKQLFDLSSGAGTLPENGWPDPNGYCGYAGGLGPDNITAQLPLIAAAAGPQTYWIDMETRIRSFKDKLFDFDKVVSVLEQVEVLRDKPKPSIIL